MRLLLWLMRLRLLLLFGVVSAVVAVTAATAASQRFGVPTDGTLIGQAVLGFQLVMDNVE